ncbi:YqcI/YcgG family protein [Trinickia fusca]|uniref:NTP pyrophosphohydrolase MazG putative catalytic core domain-containing protein n=1 Tax=Trinickia fusca TaxID=2419777 RepID=A0A494XJD8_9BURK|nr:YqcI/YcgG family protein [Trinickia fusca]RKP48239.1 hypothetical protein D7S89_12995 [Trinickia fusca]
MKHDTFLDATQIIHLSKKVRETAINLGGYWRPLSAVARVLEELGEIGELLVDDSADQSHLAAELADMFIITTCIADQYCANVVDLLKNMPPADGERGAGDYASLRVMFCCLAQRTGRLGRLINYLEGDKTPKPNEPVSNVTTEVACIQHILFRMTAATGENLVKVVNAILDMNARRDRARFKSNWDPSTALSRDRFGAVIGKTLCPFAQHAKIWGAPDIDDKKDFAYNASQIAQVLCRFCRVAPTEGLDGFVIRIHVPEQIRDLASFSSAFFHIVAELGRASKEAGWDNPMEENLSSPEWRFRFCGISFFITTFAPFYRGDHPRFSWRRDSAFVLLQPEFSFDHHGIHSNNPKRTSIKETIRQGFSRNSVGYSTDLVEQPLEALKYIKPLQLGDSPIEWWEISTMKGNTTKTT